MSSDQASVSTPAPETGFRAVTPWSPWGAMLAIVVVVQLAMSAAAVAGGLYLGLIGSGDGSLPGEMPPATARQFAMAGMVMMQLVMAGLTFWLAGLFGGRRRDVLSLFGAPTGRQIALGLAGMIALLAPYNAVVYLLWPNDFTRDLRTFSELARSEAALLAGIVVAIGAPLSEELIFRGFLLPALARARASTVLTVSGIVVLAAVMVLLALNLRLGRVAIVAVALVALAIYLAAWRLDARTPPARSEAASAEPPPTAFPSEWPAFLPAALFTTMTWTAMHVGYSAAGLVEVFLIGLYFCWLMWRFGNLWLTIALHAIYNGLQFLVLTQVTLPAPA